MLLTLAAGIVGQYSGITALEILTACSPYSHLPGSYPIENHLLNVGRASRHAIFRLGGLICLGSMVLKNSTKVGG